MVGNHDEKSNVRSFRLSPDTLEKLDQISKKENTNTNLLVTNVLDTFVSWNHSAKNVGLIDFPMNLITHIFEALPEEKIREIVENHAKYGVADIITYVEKDFSQDTFLKSLEKWLDSNKFHYEKIGGNYLKYVINLNMGAKFSFFFCELVKQVIENFERSSVKYFIYGQTVEISIHPLV
ncbi:MAG: hypothetical protein GWN01_16000 [Nitrosopumilaceae archaeon]|nr:hypothetical protein [Nitrosopumilaceae archaeon]NIU02340.1 hypothetical protein [Nitrosopumilaceae archaeon]NIU88795.1 hypothetical protein [Nitrosopumilaceae archaeon]NIV66922.1 hypothetical protein [Nitrosopumilaceae archaeon]NIX62941.1 hypothetical protein [Nitrosopumilaceae archaeon]